MNESPFLQIKAFETQLTVRLRAVDVLSLDRDGQKLIQTLRQNVTDARLDVRDYELSETRVEQLKKAVTAKELLEQIRKQILMASEYNVFSAIDVAELTAKLEQISENVR